MRGGGERAVLSSSGSNDSHQDPGNALNSADFLSRGPAPPGAMLFFFNTMPASQKFEPEDPWGHAFIMPENVGLYSVLFPMGLLLIPVFTTTGKLHRQRCRGPRSLQDGRKALRGHFLFHCLSLSLSVSFLSVLSFCCCSPSPPFFLLPTSCKSKK